MGDIDIDLFEEHELRPDKATNETFSLTPKGGWFVTRAQVRLASVARNCEKHGGFNFSDKQPVTIRCFIRKSFTRAVRPGQTTQKHKRFTKGGGNKKVQLEEHIKKEQCKLKRIREYPGVYDDAMKEDITK